MASGLEEYEGSANVKTGGCSLSQTLFNPVGVVDMSKFPTLTKHSHGFVFLLMIVLHESVLPRIGVERNFCAASSMLRNEVNFSVATFEGLYQTQLTLHICRRAGEVAAGSMLSTSPPWPNRTRAPPKSLALDSVALGRRGGGTS